MPVSLHKMLDSIEEDLKKNINNKLIFGIKEKI